MSDASRNGTWSPRRLSFKRSDGTPKYVAISRAIASAITEKELQNGELMPSQRELAESFGVTLMTVRQAIQVLTNQGLVTTEQGKGTYVFSPPYLLPMGPLSSFARHVQDSGRELVTELLGFSAIEVSPIEQRRMGLSDPRAFELVRLRSIDGDPLVLQTSLMPPDVARFIDVERLRTTSLYELLESDAGVRVERATETVQAISVDRESARYLKRRAGEPAMMSARLTFSTTGRAVVDDRALIVGDKVVISVERRANEAGVNLLLNSASDFSTRSTTSFVRSRG